MKIAMAQIETVPGHPDQNVAKMLKYIAMAKKAKADMIIFPELCIPGYLIGDQWEESAFINDCENYDSDIRSASEGLTVIYGNVSAGLKPTKHFDGRNLLFNTLWVTKKNKDGRMSVWSYFKSLLPNYREFEEPRHFRSSMKDLGGFYTTEYFTPLTSNSIKLGLTVCEDGWSEDYPIDPIAEYVKRGAQLIINISCSPYTAGKNKARDRVFGQGHAKTNKIPLIYVNAVGLQNNGKSVYTFDGSSVAYNSKGEVVVQAPMFEEALYYVEYKDGDLVSTSTDRLAFFDDIRVLPKGVEETVAAMKYGFKKFIELCKTNKVVVGVSGGIDSSVVASLAAQVVGPENLLLANMPSKYNSETTKNIAKELAEKIGCAYVTIPIEESIELTIKQIEEMTLTICGVPQTDNLHLTPLHLENVQARDRSSRILAALASAWGGVFTCNGNKTEITVAYTTLYGDLGGFFAPLGDLWKHQVYEVGRELNETENYIPEEAFSVVPSAELSSEQNVDEGKGDPLLYWYHDHLFESWQQWWIRVTPEENFKWYLDGTINEKLNLNEIASYRVKGLRDDVYKLFPTVKEFCEDLERWYKLFKGLSVAKRVQAPPVLGLTRRSYGFDYRDYLGEAYFTRKYYEMKNKALNSEAT